MKVQYVPTVLSLVMGLVSGAHAQSWPVYGGDSGNTRFSAAKQINTTNVNKLKVAWALQLGSVKSQESTPILVGDTLFVTSSEGPKSVFALNAKTGEVKWRYSPEVPKGLAQYGCCETVNRGVTHADGKIFVGRVDGNVVALDAKTGKELWITKVIEPTSGALITSPPTVAKNMVITGFGGGEFGVRGAIVALDQASGKEMWRTYTVPSPGEPGNETWKGDSWKNGGGPAWNVGSYDAQLNLVYYGTGNASPWSGLVRGNDSSDIGPYTNLYTSSVVAMKPETGQIVWHYQFTPHDVWDRDGVNEMVFADLPVNGQKTPVILHADRNGFFYVIDRRNGKLVSAKPFVDQNWATEIDLKTGRPIEVANNAKRPQLNRKVEDICPGALGGKNWMPMSFNPQTGLAYIPTLNLCMDMKSVEAEYKRGTFYFGQDFDLDKAGHGGFLGGVKAWDPVKQKEVWFNKEELPLTGGTLSTAGGLVFHGDTKGWFKALNAKTGKTLWKFNSGSGINQAPMTYELDGKQYVAVVAGRTTTLTGFLGSNIGSKVANASPEGGALYVFELQR